MTDQTQSGLFGVLRGGAQSLLAAAQSRLSLLANEIEVEKLRTFRLLLLAQALMFCLGLAFIFCAGLVIFVFWDQRIPVIAGLSALFFMTSYLLYKKIACIVNDSDPLFAATLAELQEDLRQLKAAAL